ncbi:hypothetical protein MVEN_02320800 [Mycena venus]|uniref:Uncharacterized protein n=1 Tax=Mycena venus TaxID=2733690 RepID=A0A8H6X4S2_9AGAR|nr:hypothetical protein MVEN_02320800 [Mycena venus]
MHHSNRTSYNTGPVAPINAQMHSLTFHSLAHKGPPSTRTQRRAPAISGLSSNATPLYGTKGLKKKDPLGLIDYAVKSLCEIWCPGDIPTVYMASYRPPARSDQLPPTPKSRRRNTQSPFPVSPLTRTAPHSSLSGSSACVRPVQAPLACEHGLTSSRRSRRNLLPIKDFIHEVLRRSHTSTSVLITALSYLDGIRDKVRDLIQKEQAGEGVRGEPVSDFRVMRATAAELELGGYLSSVNCDFAAGTHCEKDAVDTIGGLYKELARPSIPASTSWVVEDRTAALTTQQPRQHKYPPLPSLPSPLLCPRRAFLASLILADKFMHDKCYSNRDWAKLSGLTVREIGRCERALGGALDWRLWVGKIPLVSHGSSSIVSTPVLLENGPS